MSEQHPHLGDDTLADLQEGLLDGDGEAAARRHLETCVTCRADLATLTALPGLLAAAGDVGPVPELVAAGLDRALAAEAARPAVSPATRTITPDRPAQHSPVRGMRLLQAAAVIVLVLGAGAIGISALPHGGSGDNASTSAGAADSAGGDRAAAEAASAPLTASGRNWTKGTLMAAAPALAAGTFGPAFSTYDRKAAARDDAGGGTGSAQSPSPSAGSSLENSPAVPPAALAAGPASRLADPAALDACIVNLADGGPVVQPLAVDLATYQGQPAAVLVFPAADDRAALDVFVVAPDCPTGLFLDFLRVPRS